MDPNARFHVKITLEADMTWAELGKFLADLGDGVPADSNPIIMFDMHPASKGPGSAN